MLFWPSLNSHRAAFVPHSRATACQGENQFWPFIDVLREVWLGVTRKIAKDLRTADYTDPTDGFWAGVRRGGRLQLDV
ncbi:MAG: hypothetical protein DMF16_04620 [Verrucomicrobia bacterium]|nr:MAG: hypothetical protein DMF16_04620 [Verrucomicrobiota bacterium]